MIITYDILVDDEDGDPCDVMKSSIEDEKLAFSLLAKARKRQPKAYLVRNMTVRMLETGNV